MLSQSVINAIFINFLVIAIASALLLSIKVKKQKYHNKNLNRYNALKNETDDEILKRLRDEAKYNKDFKYGVKYVKQYTSFFAKAMKLFGVNLDEIQHKIDRANDKKYTAEEIAVKKVIAYVGAFAFAFIGAVVHYYFFIMAFAIFFAMGTVAESELNKKYEERKGKFRADLPSYLRLVANATSVGNSIEEALAKVGSRYPSVITEEIRKADHYAQYSNDWLGALMFVSSKADIDEFEQLVSEIRITKEKGASITEVLEKLAEKVEKENAYALEAIARKKASALIVPTAIFLFLPMMLTILLPVGSMVMNML